MLCFSHKRFIKRGIRAHGSMAFNNFTLLWHETTPFKMHHTKLQSLDVSFEGGYRFHIQLWHETTPLKMYYTKLQSLDKSFEGGVSFPYSDVLSYFDFGLHYWISSMNIYYLSTNKNISITIKRNTTRRRSICVFHLSSTISPVNLSTNQPHTCIQ